MADWGGALQPLPVGLDVALDDDDAQLGRSHSLALREIAKDGRMGPLRPRLHFLRAHEHPRVIAELVGDLDHGHEAGVHADQVDLAAEGAMRPGEHALELAVVEAVRRAVVVGDAAVGGEGLLQALTRGVEDGRRLPRCGSGSWGGRCPSLGDYVTGTGATKGCPPPEGVDVGYSFPALPQALTGRFRAHHAFLVSQFLAHLDSLDEAVDAVSTQIDTVRAPFHEALARLDTIHGVNTRTAEVLIAELGADLTVCPATKHGARWAGLCPDNHESAGTHRSGRTRHGHRWLRTAWIETALAASVRSTTGALAARDRRIMPHRGHKNAVGAAHAMLVIAYHLLARQTTYQDPGSDYPDRPPGRARWRRAIQTLERQGFRVALEPAARARDQSTGGFSEHPPILQPPREPVPQRLLWPLSRGASVLANPILRPTRESLLLVSQIQQSPGHPR
jgi:transposase IS116/IS110/IS902 family protein